MLNVLPKFRVFEKWTDGDNDYQEMMWYVTTLRLDSNEFEGRSKSGSEARRKLDGCCSLMQFTGLLDKNGYEIYSGDIVKINNKNMFEVIFKDGAFSINDLRGEIPLNTFKQSQLEVIGNIFETPDLLEKEKSSNTKVLETKAISIEDILEKGTLLDQGSFDGYEVRKFYFNNIVYLLIKKNDWEFFDIRMVTEADLEKVKDISWY